MGFLDYLGEALLTDHGIRAVSCLALGIATVISAVLFARCAWKEEGVEFRGHWGGFGGGSGGWVFSRSLSFLLASIAFGAFLAVVAISDTPKTSENPSTGKSNSSVPAAGDTVNASGQNTK